MQNLTERYEAIKTSFQRLSDFSAEDLESSRALFETSTFIPTPRRFDVWTCICGLPVSYALTTRLRALVGSVQALLPPGTRTYWVDPRNYHCEILVIKRPDEEVPEPWLRETATILDRVSAVQPPFVIVYEGLVITPDGTVIAQGYGQLDELRSRLRASVPVASPRQSNLAHISLGRILDPIGQPQFAVLQAFVKASQGEPCGTLWVDTVKYVHERQWYMEDRDVVGTFRLGTHQS